MQPLLLSSSVSIACLPAVKDVRFVGSAGPGTVSWRGLDALSFAVTPLAQTVE